MMAGRSRKLPVAVADVVDAAVTVPVETGDVRLLPLSALRLASGNVRRGKRADLLPLAESIAALGVLQNLGVVVHAGGDAEVHYGSRRLAALQQLAKAGRIAGDYSVPCRVLREAPARESALAENFQRVAMGAADEVRAFAALVAGGATIEVVAARFGQTVRFVRQRLRLAGLHADVLAALEAGTITLDVAQAFASVDDPARQAAVLKNAGGYVLMRAALVSEQMRHSSCTATDIAAVYAGREAYVARGGRISADLFSEAEDELWLDGDMVDAIVQEKLRAEAPEWQARHGFGRVLVAGDEEPEDLASIIGEWVQPGAAMQMPTEQRAGLIVTIGLRRAGVEVTGANRMVDAVPVSDAFSPARADEGEPDDAELAQPEAEAAPAAFSGEITQSAKAAMAMRGRDLLASRLLRAGDPAAFDVCFRLVAFTMADDMVRRFGKKFPGAAHTRLCAVEFATQVQDPLAPGKDGQPWAGDALDTVLQNHFTERADDGLNWAWAMSADADDRFAAFCALDADVACQWFMRATAASLRALQGATLRNQAALVAGQLDGETGVPLWRPTAENYFLRSSGKNACLEMIAECFGEGADVSGWAKWKKADLAAACEALARGDAAKLGADITAYGKWKGPDTAIEPVVAAAGAVWMPAIMRIGGDA
ncbi:ParB/RepB/Spo0J family partition protein [Sandarakinorhabdus sp.]|uniref:ParB/RepB/Spo0J family partition protein n=1 Tax=Sandarakinorhabdus sp. TaxID=1916663 RepID=UPI00286E127B|nr:ParB/RepB/Spo0J family partition protein [Sandarakinorhabdus sp.]